MPTSQLSLTARHRYTPSRFAGFAREGDPDFAGGTRLQHMPPKVKAQPKPNPQHLVGDEKKVRELLARSRCQRARGPTAQHKRYRIILNIESQGRLTVLPS